MCMGSILLSGNMSLGIIKAESLISPYSFSVPLLFPEQSFGEYLC